MLSGKIGPAARSEYREKIYSSTGGCWCTVPISCFSNRSTNVANRNLARSSRSATCIVPGSRRIRKLSGFSRRPEVGMWEAWLQSIDPGKRRSHPARVQRKDSAGEDEMATSQE
jgi:hypothetical protein